MFFWVMAPYSLVVVTSVSKEHTASLFKVEGEGCPYVPPKCWYPPTTIHDVITLKTTVGIFTMWKPQILFTLLSSSASSPSSPLPVLDLLRPVMDVIKWNSSFASHVFPIFFFLLVDTLTFSV
jgi:hypothetical protein